MRSELERYYRRRRFLRSPNETLYELDGLLPASGESYTGSRLGSRSSEEAFWEARYSLRTPGEAFFHNRS
jgi:hypothetical protein